MAFGLCDAVFVGAIPLPLLLVDSSSLGMRFPTSAKQSTK
jgi:hypothetical protein